MTLAIPTSSGALAHLPAPGRLARRAARACTARRVIALLLAALACTDLALTGADPLTLSSLPSAASVLLVRRHPWAAVALVGLPLLPLLAIGAVSTAFVSCLLTLPLLIADNHKWPALTLFLCFIGGDATASLRGEPTDGRIFAFYSILLGTSVGTGLVIRASNRGLLAAETARDEALRTQRLLIAQELQSILTQANKLVSEATVKALALEPRSPAVVEALEDIAATTRDSEGDLRAMLRVLRQQEASTSWDALPANDLLTTLDSAQTTLTHSGLRATISHDGDLAALPQASATVIVHAVNEAVANMTKYAAHDFPCTIQIEVSAERVIMLAVNSVAEHRRPAPPALTSGYGIAGLKERAQALGGSLRCTPTNHRWVLSLSLPLENGAK